MADPYDHLREFLTTLGLDPKVDPHLAETPRRVAQMLEDLFNGASAPAPQMSVFDAEGSDPSPVQLQALGFRSMCVHHLLPFFGTIDIAYVPGEKIAGFSSFIRIIDWAAGRPQIQERLVEQIADELEAQLQPPGLIVRARARQMCVEMRVGRPGTYVSVVSRGTLQQGSLRESTIAQFVAAERPI
jgi:GTP cyclohydrolase IA